MQSIPHVVDVVVMRGVDASDDVTPSLLVELPHGATLAADFFATKDALNGPFPDQLEDFFFVNTDVGSPEVGHAVASQYLAAHRHHAAVLVCSRIPRTFVDCNRVLGGRPAESAAITPGLPPYVTDPADQQLLIERHAMYQQVVDGWIERVAGGGGLVLMLHTYAPRSVGVSVDADIVSKLHGAYAPDVVGRWPLRPSVDIICKDMDGNTVPPEGLVLDVVAAFAEIDVVSAQGETYPLHPATTAAHRAMKYPSQSLCVEIRRDLLVDAFTPFAEMIPDSGRVARMAQPLASVLINHCRTN